MDVPIMKIEFETLTRSNLEDFLDWLETTRGSNISTRNQRLVTLKSFYTYASNRDVVAVSYAQEIYKIPVKQSEKTNDLKYFSEDVLKLLLKQPDTSNKRGIRNLFFTILLYDTGGKKTRDIRFTFK